MYVFYSLMKRINKLNKRFIFSGRTNFHLKNKKWINGNSPMKDSTFNGGQTIIFHGRVFK